MISPLEFIPHFAKHLSEMRGGNDRKNTGMKPQAWHRKPFSSSVADYSFA